MTHDEWAALLLSFRVAVVAVVVTLPPGVFFGWLLSRRRFPGRILLEAVLHLPLVVPPIATGYVLLVLFSRKGPLGGPLYDLAGIEFAFDWKGAVLASAVAGFPLLLRSVKIAFDAVDPRLEAAARTLGAGRLRAWATVTLPLARSGIAAGCVLAFARSLGEFGATIALVANIPGRTQTVPLAVFNYLNQPGQEAAAARLVAASVALSLAALVASELLVRRSGMDRA